MYSPNKTAHPSPRLSTRFKKYIVAKFTEDSPMTIDQAYQAPEANLGAAATHTPLAETFGSATLADIKATAGGRDGGAKLPLPAIELTGPVCTEDDPHGNGSPPLDGPLPRLEGSPSQGTTDGGPKSTEGSGPDSGQKTPGDGEPKKLEEEGKTSPGEGGPKDPGVCTEDDPHGDGSPPLGGPIRRDSTGRLIP